MRKRAVCPRRGDDARLIHASITTLTWWWASFQTSQANDHSDWWQLFHPGEQGLHQATKPCWVLATHKLSPFSLVTYPPPAVMPQVSTNLGPVARLEQPFLVWHCHATCESCTVQKNGCHTAVLFLHQCWLLTPVGEIVAWRVLQICSFCTSNMPVEISCKKYWFQKSSHLSTVVFTFSNKVLWHNCS